MFLGIDLPNLIRFITQVAGVTAAASALWGFYLLQRGKRNPEFAKCIDCAFNLMPLFTGAFFVFITGWFINAFKFFPIFAAAHEGIVHNPPVAVQLGFAVGFQWVVAAVLLGLAGIGLYFFKRRFFEKYASGFYLWQFILFSIIIAFTAYAGGKIDTLQSAFMLHNWHSIITLGTVIVVDYLFLTTEKRDDLKRALYPTFPVMSAFIWFGLGMEFVSTYLFLQAGGITVADITITGQFLFNQLVIAVLILNGALLSVRLNDKLISLIKKDKIEQLKGRVASVVRVSGSVSIVSWLTVTFLDFFEIPLAFWHFFGIYLALIFLAWLSKPLVEKRFI